MKDADNGGWSRNRYKAWAVAVILLLAVWSMLSGSARLARKWSVVHNPFSSSAAAAAAAAAAALLDDADPLEMEMREKIVRHAWEGYRFNPRSKEKLSSFWHEAFEAAFEDLESENPIVSDNAVREIARLSVHAFQLDPRTGKPKSKL